MEWKERESSPPRRREKERAITRSKDHSLIRLPLSSSNSPLFLSLSNRLHVKGAILGYRRYVWHERKDERRQAFFPSEESSSWPPPPAAAAAAPGRRSRFRRASPPPRTPHLPSLLCFFGLSATRALSHLSSPAPRRREKSENATGWRRCWRSLFCSCRPRAERTRELFFGLSCSFPRRLFPISLTHVDSLSNSLSLFLCLSNSFHTGGSARSTTTRRSSRSRASSPRARRSSTSAR